MVNQSKLISFNAKLDQPLTLSKPENNATTQIWLNPGAAVSVLGAVALLLILASTATQLMNYLTGYNSVFIHKLIKIFSVDIELNAPNFFSMLILILAALLLMFIAILKKKQKAPHTLYWVILSLGFLLMAFDEIVSAHEKLVEPLRAVLGKDNLGILYFAWVVPGIAVVLFLSFFFLKFWLNLPARTRFFFLIAGAFYVGGAIGLELIGGRHYELHGKENLTYMILTTVEESLEITGVIIFIWALLAYITDTFKDVQVRLYMRRADEQKSEKLLMSPISVGFEKRC